MPLKRRALSFAFWAVLSLVLWGLWLASRVMQSKLSGAREK